MNDSDYDSILGIDKIAPKEDVWVDRTRVADIVGLPLILRSFEIVKGSLGTYAVIEAENAETGEEMVISCGGSLVKTQLIAVEKQQAFPVRAHFSKDPDSPDMWILL